MGHFGSIWENLGDFRQGGGLSKEDFEDLAENLARAWANAVQHAMLSPRGGRRIHIQLPCGPSPPPCLYECIRFLSEPTVEAQSRPKIGSRWIQNRAKLGPNSVPGAPREPSGARMPPKSDKWRPPRRPERPREAPRAPQERPKSAPRAPGSDFHDFLGPGGGPKIGAKTWSSNRGVRVSRGGGR